MEHHKSTRGERDGKLSEEALLRIDGYETTELVYEVFCDVQAQSDAFLVDRLVFLHHFAEQLEHACHVGLADADTRVIEFKLDSLDHGNFDTFRVHSHLDSFSADLNVALECELSRISQNVDQDLLQTLVVALDDFGRVLSHGLDKEDIGLESQLHVDQLEDLGDKFGHIDGVKIHRELASLHLREVQRVINQGKQECRGAFTDFEVHLREWVDVGTHADETVLDGVDRRSELVADRGEHDLRVLLHNLLALQLLLSRDVRKDENNLPLSSCIVRLDSDVVVDTIEFVGIGPCLGLLLLLSLLVFLVAVRAIFADIVARRG